ncbi:glycosyltransferase family 2 protein [Bacillus sp. HMF5848]|uniref:glycosyltransferase family 2 protein n=1 Tax=Bacillus sp. HMF5848 TaxID=2495421 RepID=UPI000F7B420E|nr:glycosyltransferase family 2 protein [Bacillus sp. HMF5848]RSK28618.1 glycosyltransferase family 2 protein [Bacillus sp. HMF5848]
MENVELEPKISIYTVAYNAELYIKECIDSVMNQTFQNFEWVILDNGSIDSTGEILETLAKKDQRIKLFKNDKNTFIYNVPYNPEFVSHGENLKTDYYCALDSDDFLHPEFLKVLYTQAIKYDADIVLGGTEMFNEKNIQERGLSCPPDFFIEETSNLGDFLSDVYRSLRPMWGKLIKVSIVLKQILYRNENPLILKNAGDTLFCLDCLSFSQKIVGVNKVLHYYRVRGNSYYKTDTDDKRYKDYIVIYYRTKELLLSWEKLHNKNVEFIAQVLYISIKELIEMIWNANNSSIFEKLKATENIINDKELYDILTEHELIPTFSRSVIESIKDITVSSDITLLNNSYLFRLCKSVTNNNTTPHDAFLLFLSSVFDEKNINQFGSEYLFNYLSYIGKIEIKGLFNRGIDNIIIQNKSIFVDILNGNYGHIGSKINKLIDNDFSEILKEELFKFTPKITDFSKDELMTNIGRYIEINDYDLALNILCKLLEAYPLDKVGLSYKIYLLTLKNDKINAAVAAKVLTIFYDNDSDALLLAGRAYANSGLKGDALKCLEVAFTVCNDELAKYEIEQEIMLLKNKGC